MQEIWKDIKGYEGYYQVSNQGKVRSLNRKVNVSNGERIIKGKILKPYLMPNGYLLVDLRKKQSHKRRSVHRLVAETFISNPNNFSVVNHKDSNPSNNRIDNLEWCTQSHNVKYAYIHGNAKPTKGCFKKGNIPHNLRKVNQYDKNNNFIASYQSIKEASIKNKISHTAIQNCLLNITKTSGGFIWKYAD